MTLDRLLYDLGLILNRDAAGNVLSSTPPNPLPAAPYAVTDYGMDTPTDELRGGAQVRRVGILVSLYGFKGDAAGAQSCAVVLAHVIRRAREIDAAVGYPRIWSAAAADVRPPLRDAPSSTYYASARLLLSYTLG